MTTSPRRRSGYSLIELLAVLAILTLLGGILAPSIRLLGGDTHVKAGADAVVARAAEARASAIEEGRAYRVSVSSDGHMLRVAPDDETTDMGPTADDPNGPFVFQDTLPDKVTVVFRPADGSQPADRGGWVRVATFMPDGTCREDSAVVEVREPGCHSMIVRIRGLTGSATVTSAPAGGN